MSQFQFLQCSKSLISQSGLINAQTNTLDILYPSTSKTQSTWKAAANLDYSIQDNTLLGGDLWTNILNAPPGTMSNGITQYLESYLGLDEIESLLNPSMKSKRLMLHDIENALSNLLAMTFWIGANIHPDPWYMRFSDFSSLDPKQGTSPVVASSKTILQQETLRLRLDSNIIPITLGFGTSLLLAMICISLLHSAVKEKGAIEASGILHNIWLWRSHPRLRSLLSDIKQPTEANLRTAGLIPIQLSAKDMGSEDMQQPGNPRSFGLDHHSLTSASSWSKLLFPMCITFHVLLVVIFLCLLGLSISEAEHRISFSLDKQHTVSFWCKVVATIFGTVYYTLLVYLTQRSAMTRIFQEHSTLTATHDQVSAWAGIGSAAITLSKQVTSPSSVLRIFAISLYLSTVSILHVTTPALVSVESFNVTITTSVQTRGIPEFPDPRDNSTLLFFQNTGVILPWITQLNGLIRLGLSNGSLYDVMTDAYPGSVTAQVPAIGFDITCGYLTGVIAKPIDPNASWTEYNVSFPTEQLEWHSWSTPGSNTIVIANQLSSGIDIELPTNSIILYTQSLISDSHGTIGPSMTVPQSNVTVQFLQCTRSLVSQTGQVDTGSRSIIPDSLSPVIQKKNSTWARYQSPQAANSTSLVEGDDWAQILASFDLTDILFIPGNFWSPDWGSIYLMQQLGLEPPISIVDQDTDTSTSTSELLYLHDIENAVSNLVASTFWIGGHIQPIQEMQRLQHDDKIPRPVLSTTSTTVRQDLPAARLDMSVVAVSIGLGASIVLLILAITLSTHQNQSILSMYCLGFLHIIWVFQHHPKLSQVLEQVEEPNDCNLRAAGLVTVRLSDVVLEQHH
ncbi:hypothetical protein C8F04DRAFT_353328 [Mycena alexandri]|uniref:Uncharacterized protein n=1 Tax=Mycena alexandri TaxID=1745969 RepID=A0AAD6WPN1_9AGAR|nr:hypothetical protein C8F04DRAFT_353328 [Mycena alexandri]